MSTEGVSYKQFLLHLTCAPVRCVPHFWRMFCLEPFIRVFVRLQSSHSDHIATPPALSRAPRASAELSSASSVRARFIRLFRAYDPQSLYSLGAVRSSSESPSRRYPFIWDLGHTVLQDCFTVSVLCRAFVGYSYRFARGTRHTICKLIGDDPDRYRETAAVI